MSVGKGNVLLIHPSSLRFGLHFVFFAASDRCLFLFCFCFVHIGCNYRHLFESDMAKVEICASYQSVLATTHVLLLILICVTTKNCGKCLIRHYWYCRLEWQRAAARSNKTETHRNKASHSKCAGLNVLQHSVSTMHIT